MQLIQRLPLLAIIHFGLYCFCSSPNKSPAQPEQRPTFQDGLLFDDFNYETSNDPVLKTNGWTLRTGAGGPGPDGCVWDNELIAFKNETLSSNNRILALSAWTQGSPMSCHQAEIFTPTQFKNGTFAARVLFSDRPDYGPNGDGLVQTFFTIAPWMQAEHDAYAEFDFEYLPNGGWGLAGAHLWQTSWETMHDKKSDHQESSHAGAWQQLLIQTDVDETRYFVNDELRALHNPPYIADGSMSINFNHWFIGASLDHEKNVKRHYTYYVDWVIALDDLYYSPVQIDSLVSQLRAKNHHFYNSLPSE